ncbi:2'-5'-oligoadenylate synthase 2 [Pteronotus mesoamericanus]|uniref:2'-5'-oligoadenylate synthase 2 n=1 Tax=Pteronotus mesoamericanus TaxID=1884717 RepID=UPI0023EE0F0D|nr:2'-5'-oligoadenylate synthase 2 [Pteronotus parnellii mesoamericanus]
MGNWLSSVNPTSVISVPAQRLGDYIQDYLRPSEDCQKQIDLDVDTICAALQETEELPTVTSVAKGGLYGRKTVLRGKSYGTLIIFTSDLGQFQDQTKKSKHEILNKIYRWLKASQLKGLVRAQMEIEQSNSGLSIQLSSESQTIIFAVLPAFDAVGVSEKPSPWTYRELKRTLDKTEASPGEFSICFTKLQQNFFNDRPRKLKDLILLVIDWYLQCQKKMKDMPKLPLYALELLTVYAWEQGCGAEDFDLVEGIRTVLGLIMRHEELCVYWTVNYDFEDVTTRNIMLNQIRSPRPVILDPTNPTNNVSQDKTCWLLLKEEAQFWLSSPSLRDLPGPPWNVLPTPLHETPGHRLDAFIKFFLQPNQTFLDQMSSAVDIICRFLREECFQRSTTKVQKSVKGGSTSKGTALKTGSDADIVLFIDSLESYVSQKTKRSHFIGEIRKQLEALQGRGDQKFKVKFEISKRDNPRVLSFSLKSKDLSDSVDFDVLPAYDALGQVRAGFRPSPSVYTELISLYKSSNFTGGEFSTCFTELQRNFVISRPTKLKDLIRLIKHWYKQCERKLKKKGSLPPKYALELLTVHAWEHGSGVEDFDTAEGFRTVLELVTRYQQLCIFWTVNYDFEDKTMKRFLLTQIQRTRPVILDPADPTGDVGGGQRWCWHFLAQEATEWLSFSMCFRDGTGAAIPPWNVPTEQTPESCGANTHPNVSEIFSSASRGIRD